MSLALSEVRGKVSEVGTSRSKEYEDLSKWLGFDGWDDYLYACEYEPYQVLKRIKQKAIELGVEMPELEHNGQ